MVRIDGYCVRPLSPLDVEGRACTVEVVDKSDVLVLEDVWERKVVHCCGFASVDVVDTTVIVSTFLVFLNFFLSKSCPYTVWFDEPFCPVLRVYGLMFGGNERVVHLGFPFGHFLSVLWSYGILSW